MYIYMCAYIYIYNMFGGRSARADSQQNPHELCEHHSFFGVWPRIKWNLKYLAPIFGHVHKDAAGACVADAVHFRRDANIRVACIL